MKTEPTGVLKKIIIGLIIVTVFCAGFRVFKNIKKSDYLLSGITADIEDEYNAYEDVDSDIDGMTVAQKMDMGLLTANDSDTDKDGLTDKEELEIYNSDPLKASTSGDDYSDGYKVANGLDINTKYSAKNISDYSVKENNCPEIHVVADSADGWAGTINDITDEKEKYWESEIASHVYKVYSACGFGGDMSIEYTAKDNTVVAIRNLFENETGFHSCKFKISDGKLELNENFKSDGYYQIVVTDDSFPVEKQNASVFSKISGVVEKYFGDDSNYQSELPIVLITDVPIVSACTPAKMYNIYFAPCGDGFLDDYYLDLVARWYSWDYNTKMTGNRIVSTDEIKIVSTEEITKKINHLSDTFGGFEWKPPYSMDGVKPFLFTWFTLDDIKAYMQYRDYYSATATEEGSEKWYFPERTEQYIKETGNTALFDFETDVLPFENFGSYISEEGNCGGFAWLTAVLHNKGSISSTGSYTVKEDKWNVSGEISYNLGGDEENTTLLDAGLHDYKDDTFVNDHSDAKVINQETLTDGESEFVKMMGARLIQTNEITYPCAVRDDEDVDAALFKNFVLTSLDAGDVLQVALVESATEGLFTHKYQMGHFINVYGYKDMGLGEYHLLVYDNNFPNEALTMYVYVYQNAEGKECLAWYYDGDGHYSTPFSHYMTQESTGYNESYSWYGEMIVLDPQGEDDSDIYLVMDTRDYELLGYDTKTAYPEYKNVTTWLTAS